MGDRPTSAPADCECRPGAHLRQEVNAISSLAYVAAGVDLARATAARRLPPTMGILAAAVALEGVGSTWFHGGAGAGAQAVHDLPLLTVMGYLAGWYAGRLVDPVAAGADPAPEPTDEQAPPARWWHTSRWTTAERAAVAGAVGATVLGGGVWLRANEAVNLVLGGGTAVVAIGELVARRRGQPAVLTPTVVALFAGSSVAWLAGRSESPVCRPASRAQPHALWHAGTALGFSLWARAAAR